MSLRGQLSKPVPARVRNPQAQQQNQQRSLSNSPNTEANSTPGTAASYTNPGGSSTRSSTRSASPVPRLDLPSSDRTETSSPVTRKFLMDAQIQGLTSQLASSNISTQQQQSSQRATGTSHHKSKSILDGTSWNDIGTQWIDSEVVGYFSTIHQLERLQSDMELRQRKHGGLDGELAALKMGIKDLFSNLIKKRTAWVKNQRVASATPEGRGRRPGGRGSGGGGGGKPARLEQPAWKY